MRILYVISEDWFFASHFAERADVLQRSGSVVGVATRHKSQCLVETETLRLFEMETNRGSLNILADIRALFQLYRACRIFKPDILHCVAMKPNMFGALIGLFLGLPCVFAPTGLGYLFTRDTPVTRLVRNGFLLTLKAALRQPRNQIIIENSEDLQFFVDRQLVKSSQIHLIRGAGIDTDYFIASQEPRPPITVLCVSRLLADKGIREFFTAAQHIRALRPDVRFLLVGGTDANNPTSLQESEVVELAKSSGVIWLGQQNDVYPYYRDAHIVCLPSYREGLPKVLLEAAASGRCIVTTDVVGCREIVKHEITGILVEARNADALAEGLLRVIDDAPLRKRLALAVCGLMASGYSTKDIATQTQAVYDLVSQ